MAAIACCLCWYLAWHNGYPPVLLSCLITLLITFIGVWSSGVVEKIWGKDPSKVVIDEVAGMCVSLLFLPVQLKYVIAALVMFRFFDIAKPFLIKKVELLPGGWGIMMDDVLAGIYSNALISAAIWFKLF